MGMKFAPIGQDLMVSVWETRLSDYERFTTESGKPAARPPYFQQTPDHPVVNVSRVDAREFCDWLTERERKQERIAETHFYRLPTDLEWSEMVGLQEEGGISPAWRDARKPAVYPWGNFWPTGQVVGNFADAAAAASPGVSIDRTFAGYDDGFAHTAPVGSFPANSLGLHDLSGNVQEWVADEYTKLGDNPLGVLRGGGWSTYQPENLYSGWRNPVPPDFQDAIYGFRVVLAKVPPPKTE
jgi:eukaryotic-like serine/threonine-protein kinase